MSKWKQLFVIFWIIGAVHLVYNGHIVKKDADLRKNKFIALVYNKLSPKIYSIEDRSNGGAMVAFKLTHTRYKV